MQHASSTIEADGTVATTDPAPATAPTGVARPAAGPSDEPALDFGPRPTARASWNQLAAGAAVLVGLALLLLRTDTAGQVWGAVLAVAGLAATVVVEWIEVARRRALQRRLDRRR